MERKCIETRLLSAFVALVEEGGVEQAATRLGLTQSAVSHTLKVLQDDMGVQLLIRRGRRISPTPEGMTFFEDARDILRRMHTARERVQNLGSWHCTRLRIGASASTCQYLLPSVLREFKESFPQTPITIESGDTPQVMDLLRNGQVDLGIGIKLTESNEFISRNLFRDELRLLASPLHPIATNKRLTAASLAECSIILYSKSSVTYGLIQDYFQSLGLTLNQTMELGNMETIKEFVKINLGVTILAPWMAQHELKENSLIERRLPGRKLVRSWVISYPVNRKLNLGEETFIGLCESASQNLRLSSSYVE